MAPLLTLWFGYGILPKVLLVGLACFFPVAVGVVDGLEAADPELIALARTMDATPDRVFAAIAVISALSLLLFWGVNRLGVWQRLGRTILFTTHDIEEALFLADRVYVLSARPARVVLELPVDLPRPRPRSIVTRPEFNALKGALWVALHPQATSP